MQLYKDKSLPVELEYPLIVFNDHIGRQIMIDGFYEYRHLVNSLSIFDFDTRATNMVDVGANIGNHSLFYHKYFKEIYSFEPQKRTYKVLHLNALPYNNIKTFNYGLSEVDEQVRFSIPKQNTGEATDSLNSVGNYYEEEVHLRRFDDLHDFSFGFVKIDVEGNEHKALGGMTNQLRINKPIIAFEYHNENKDLAIKILKSIGYCNFYVFSAEQNRGTIKKLMRYRTNDKLRKIELPSKQNFSMCFAECDDSRYKINKAAIML